MQENSRVLIIGGGIIGHVLAWRLSSAHPDSKILLVERDLPGNGASARSAGLHFPLGRSSRTRRMSKESSEFYLEAIASGSELPISRVPLRVHCSVEQLPQLREELHSGNELSESKNTQLVQAYLGSSYPIWETSNANIAQVQRLVIALRAKLADRVSFLDGLDVVKLMDGVSPVATFSDGTSIATDRVILSPGPWALSEPFRSYTSHLGIRIKRVVAFHIEEPDPPREWVDLFYNEDAFLMPSIRGGTLFSFTRNEWDVSPEDCMSGVSEGDRAEAESFISLVAPRLTKFLKGGQIFCDAYSADRTPIISPIGEHGRMFFAGAANGAGYRFAPTIAGEAVAALNIEGQE